MAGMAWQTTHVAETHKNAFPYNATKNLPTTSGWTKIEDQNHTLVTNPCQSMSQ